MVVEREILLQGKRGAFSEFRSIAALAISDGRQVEITPEPMITSDAADGVAAAVVAGGGIGMSPSFIAAPFVARGELVPILTAFAVERKALFALWSESRRASPNCFPAKQSAQKRSGLSAFRVQFVPLWHY
ncbi:LysR substrate-binding domain-containing protein [Paraburkholderia xenovorans]|uniref:LysR substrate-binding domain-containing protein n=1 Tax=Paraburkholderia xenovorans TaxID=36873 RepID=UPI0038BB5CE8